MAQTPDQITIHVRDRLDAMFAMQNDLQLKINGGKRLTEFSNEERIEAIRINMLALADELHEAMGEVGWKPWASSRHINREAYVGELVDAWHFLMNLMLHVGVNPHELFMRYVNKNKKNHERQDNGYDGVTGKCPACHRDLGDVGVTCYKKPGEAYWCDTNKDRYDIDGYPVS